MAESFSVKAILSAVDAGFSSTLKKANNATEKLSDKLKNGFAFGVLTGVGQQAFNSLTNSAGEFINELNSSQAAWKTFEGNMKILGSSADDIATAKKAMQDYAAATIYSASDMSNTYAQLAAVGIKNTDKLVTAFGGLAGAAEDPAQAMKTLSQQATQMAAKPKVAWADFKLMMEQTPAGLSAVAKEMGMTMEELVTAVQKGKVSTDKFFKAVEKVGNSDGFQGMAKQYKTVDQAMSGLTETLSNKLGPIWEKVSSKAIKKIEGIIDALSEIDVDTLQKDLEDVMKKAEPYWNEFKNVAETVWAVLKKVGSVLKSVGKFFLDHADILSKCIPLVAGFVAAFYGFRVVASATQKVKSFADGVGKLFGKITKKSTDKLEDVATKTEKVGKSSKANSGSILAGAKAYAALGFAVLEVATALWVMADASIRLAESGWPAIGVMVGMTGALVGLGFGMAMMMKFLAPMATMIAPLTPVLLAFGASVLLVAAGFWVMADAAVRISTAGGAAIATFFGMVVAVAALMAVAAFLAPAMTAGAVGFVAFGIAIALVGVGALLAAAALAIVANVLPIICEYGFTGALAIGAFGIALAVFAVGAALAGVAAVVLGIGLVLAGVGVVAFGIAILAACIGVAAFAIAVESVASSMEAIADNAAKAETSLDNMSSSVDVVEAGLDAISTKAKSAMESLIDAFDGSAASAKASGVKVGTGFTQGMQAGLLLAPLLAFNAGANISKGFAQGMLSQLAIIRAAAEQMAIAADKALRAKAKIHSPSKASASLGSYWGEGFGNGILDMKNYVKNAAQRIVAVPNVATPALAGAYGGEMSADYDYYRNSEYSFEIPVTVDGRQVAKATATYTQAELDKMQTRDNRKHGRR